MKPLTAFLCIMVALSLAFSIAAFAIVAQNNGIFAPTSPTSTQSPSTPPPATSTPNPSATKISTTNPTPTGTGLYISYIESNRTKNGSLNKIYLNITVTYGGRNTATIKYSDFNLGLFIPRTGAFLGDGTTSPLNSGSFTLEPSHSSETFQLIFEYDPISYSGDNLATTYYMLQYCGAESVTWANQNYHN